jgi:hypothetical protein
MTVALEQDVEPVNMALGAAAAIAFLLQKAEELDLPDDLARLDWRSLTEPDIAKILTWLWAGSSNKYSHELIKYIRTAFQQLKKW